MRRTVSPTVKWPSETFFALIQESDDLEESGPQPPKKHHHYFWDPYETAFMTSEPAYTVDKYARIYFPVTFAVLNSIYWIVYAPDKVIFWAFPRMIESVVLYLPRLGSELLLHRPRGMITSLETWGMQGDK